MNDDQPSTGCPVSGAAYDGAPLGPDSLTWMLFGDWRGLLQGPWAGSMQNVHPQLGAAVCPLRCRVRCQPVYSVPTHVTEVTAVKRSFLVLAGALAAALVMLLGVGTSAANPYDPYYGATYAKVVERTGSGNSVIASRVGTYLPTDECIVTGSRRIVFNGSTRLLVDLNCNDQRSVGGDGNDHPGISVTSPAGKKMVVQKKRAARFS